MSLINNIAHLRFLRKKPRILPRILKDLFYVRVLGRPRLRTVDLCLTYKCDGKCPMCSAKELMKRKGRDHTIAEVQDIIKQVVDLGAIHFNFTGGEPMMYGVWNVVAAIHVGNDQPILSSLVTNSKKVTLKDMRWFKEVGLDTIQLSLESMDSDRHDALRNSRGNWAKVMQVLVWAMELKLNVCLSVVVTKDNFDEVRRIIAFGKRIGVFVLLNPISHHPDLSIKDKLPEYYELLKQGHVRADTIINWRGGSGCPAGIERIYITPYGDVFQCPHNSKSYGNVREEPLADIYKRICESGLKEYKRHCRHVAGE